MTTPKAAGFSAATAMQSRSTAPAVSARPSPAPHPSWSTRFEQAQRRKYLTRRVEIAALSPDGSIRRTQHIAPATAAFEGAFSAFARGTMIQTTRGPCAVEDITPGDLLDVVDGKPQPVTWIGSMTLTSTAGEKRVEQARLTRVMADTFGLARPMQDLVLGPGARLLRSPASWHELAPQSRLLTPARAFADGLSIVEITPPTPVALYHLCLPRHAIIRAGGLETESYHPGVSVLRDMGANMRALFLSLFAHIARPEDFGTLAHSRADQAL